MPLTPNAPDYVSQVRGIIGDLRENYLQKAQLEQQANIENARLALSYAQLNAQRENARLSSQVEAARSQASALRGLAGGAGAEDESRMLRDQIALQKSQLEFQKAIDDARRERFKEDQDQLAGNLQNQFQLALEGNNPAALEEVNAKIANSLLTQAQRTSIQENGMKAIAAKRELEQKYHNLETYDQARRLVDELNNLNPGANTPPDFEQKLGKISANFSALGNTDPRVMKAFDDTLTAVRGRSDAYLKSVTGGMVQDFVTRGGQGRLEPEWQAAYDKLLEDPKFADESTRFQSRDFSDKVQGLAFNRTKQQTEAVLQSTAKKFEMMQVAIGSSPAGTNFVDEDGRFKFPAPDLSPVEGHYASIDPLTGGLTQLKQKEIQDYNDYLQQLSRGGTSMSDVMAAMVGRTMGATPPPAKTGESAQTRRVIPNVVYNPPAPVGREAVAVQTAPPAPTALPPDVIDRVVGLYRQNPNSVYNGVPVRNIIAKMQSEGLVSMDILQSQQTQVVQPAKAR